MQNACFIRYNNKLWFIIDLTNSRLPLVDRATMH